MGFPIISLVVCLLGLVLYLLSSVGAKVNEIGRIAYAFGLLALLLQFGGRLLSIGVK